MPYKHINKSWEFIKIFKHKLPIMSHINVVYKIECKDRDASYVRQTSRILKKRINEHRNHIGIRHNDL